MLPFGGMKPILFIVFLALGPAIGAQVTPTMSKVNAVHPVVGDVEQLPDRDSDLTPLRGHDAMARSTMWDSAEKRQ